MFIGLSQIMPHGGGLASRVDHVLPVLPSDSGLLSSDSTTADGIRFSAGWDHVDLKWDRLWVLIWINYPHGTLTSIEALWTFEWDTLNVNASFNTGLAGSSDVLMLDFFFLTRFPFKIKYIWKEIAIDLVFWRGVQGARWGTYFDIWLLWSIQIFGFHYDNSQSFSLR